MKAIIASAALLLAAPVQAKEGVKLLEACNDWINFQAIDISESPSTGYLMNAANKHGYCEGVLEGVLYTMQYNGLLCPPDGITPGQVAKIVIKHLEKKPERLQENGVVLTNDLLNGLWPCQEAE